MKKILISGGAGFIGSKTCEKLYSLGYKLTVLDNLSKQIHGSNASESFMRIRDKCNFIKGDVRKKSDWSKAIKDQDAIIHLASETGTGQSMYEVAKYHDVNIMGVSNMLDVLANQKHKIKKIVLSSSRAIYGEGKYKCVNNGIVYPKCRNDEDMMSGKFELISDDGKQILTPIATDENSHCIPQSVYAVNKLYQEQILMLMGSNLNIDTTCLRYQNVYGPGQSLINPYTGILSVFSTRILNNNDIEIYEDGEQSRDFIYIDDVVDATILALENKRSSGNIFNIGYGKSISVNEVASHLKSSFDSEISLIVSGKFRKGDIRHNFADISKASSVLGFYPKINFEEGLKRFVNWVKSQKINIDKYEDSLRILKDKNMIR